MVSIIHGPRRLGVFPYESPCDGVGSDSEAFNRAILDITAEGGSVKNWRIELPANVVLTQPVPVLDRHIIAGQGGVASAIIKQFAGGVLFNFGGRVGYSGGAVMGLAVPGSTGTAGGYTILSRARSDGYAADRLRLEDLYLGSGTAAQAPFRHIEIIGSARTSPLGIREAIIRDVTCFGASSGSPVFLDTLVAPAVENLAVFPAPISGGAVTISNCIEGGFHRLNIDMPIARSGNAGCGFTDKAGAPWPA
jgi:hypothetical protein